MPLVKSGSEKAFKQNVKTLMNEVGESPHVQSRKQALAIAYENKRRNRAEGGPVHVGPIVSEVPGRTDNHPMAVPAGAYVLPAEHVSHFGENNTLAGLAHLRKIGAPGIRKLAHGAPGARAIVTKHKRRAAGGMVAETPTGHPIEINAAGGEHVLSPEEVKVIGDGDVILGHALLDNLVMQRRKSHIRTLSKLPGPARD